MPIVDRMSFEGFPDGARLPLAGVRVIDLTVVWAGPGATALLADLGAEVIRVEDPNRVSRGISALTTGAEVAGKEYHAATFPGGDPGLRPYDRSAIFNWHARNKLSVSMRLDTPEGHEAFLQLVAVSDVVVENNSARVLEKLGIGYDSLSGVNPRIIVARAPALGLAGPWRDYLGYGPNLNALVGIASFDGYAGDDPTSAGENYHMDEATPAGLAFAVLAALWDRETTGTGQEIEFPQAENVMQEIGEFVLDLQLNGRTPPVLGNADPVMFQDVFPTAEPDRWVALSLRDDRDVDALRRADVGSAEPTWAATIGRFGADALTRREQAEQLRALIADWTSTRAAEQIVSTLSAAGIPIGEVMSERRALADPHLAERGWFQRRSHESIGEHDYPGHPWRSADFDLVWARPVPSFAEDNAYVYRSVLGYTEDQIAALYEKGLINDAQVR